MAGARTVDHAGCRTGGKASVFLVPVLLGVLGDSGGSPGCGCGHCR